jgi:hypothetical protein
MLNQEIKEKKLLDEPVTYFCARPSMMLVLRSTQEIILNGKPIKISPIIAQFRDGQFSTRDSETVELADAVCKSRKFSRLVHRGPTKAEMDRAQKVAQKVKEARDKIIKEMGEDKPKFEFTDKPIDDTFAKHLERMKQREAKESNIVRGRMGLYRKPGDGLGE